MQKICIIIPCYNEQFRLPRDEFLEVFQSTNFFFCFVNDGSSDKTQYVLEMLRSGREERVQVISLPRNKGKAEAVRTGVLKALSWHDFSYIGYFDADFSTPITEALHLLEESGEDKLLIMGSRVKRLGATIERNLARHYFGRIFSTVASLTLKIPVYDTQCGAKLISTKVARQLFTAPFLTRWLFDMEILARCIEMFGRKETCTTVSEIPLKVWKRKDHSHLKISHMLKVPFELYKIYSHYKLESSGKTNLVPILASDSCMGAPGIKDQPQH
ncbi:glycosyltransferase [Cesiribacter sp. SM1]|uniref:glycosyltransferase n=1 Tax=Cesiribacter sp. SM1 TaxID=2861196 RepID=UPI001CD54DC2|nr:glycosyltransferase [Cesiribacter sp. SM1]